MTAPTNPADRPLASCTPVARSFLTGAAAAMIVAFALVASLAVPAGAATASAPSQPKRQLVVVFEPEPRPAPGREGRGLFDDPCSIEYVSEDLTGNRGDGLPAHRLQVVAFYDGAASSPELHIGLTDGGQLTVGGDAPGGVIEPFGRTIETREYIVRGCEPDGTFEVVGAEPNGVIDGLAFGVLWRDGDGRYAMIKSAHPPAQAQSRADFVGMWPLGFSRASFDERTPAISTGFGRESALAIIVGAALLPDGRYDLG